MAPSRGEECERSQFARFVASLRDVRGQILGGAVALDSLVVFATQVFQKMTWSVNQMRMRRGSKKPSIYFFEGANTNLHELHCYRVGGFTQPIGFMHSYGLPDQNLKRQLGQGHWVI